MPTDHNPYLPPTEEAAPRRAPSQRPTPAEEASKGQRFVTYLIDRTVGVGLSYGVGAMGVPPFFFGAVAELDTIPRTIVAWLWSAMLIVSYYVICEGTSQRTLGKLLVGTRVVTWDGRVPGFKQIVGRSFARFIPFDAISFFGSGLGWHDDFSDTRVVRVRASRR